MNDTNDKELFNSQLREKLKSILKIEFSSMAEELDKMVKALNKVDYEFAMKEAELLTVYSSDFRNTKSLDSQNDVFRQIVTLGALESEINTFNESLNMMQDTPTQTTLNSIVKSVLNKIKTLSSRLWQLLSQLLSLKEWSISGDAGINMLGLSGRVTLQLKFH